MPTFTDDLLEKVLDVLLQSPGQKFDQGDPGEVLFNLTGAATGKTSRSRYTQVCAVVIQLEQMGWVRVDRLYHDEPARANPVISITVVA